MPGVPSIPRGGGGGGVGGWGGGGVGKPLGPAAQKISKREKALQPGALALGKKQSRNGNGGAVV